MGRAVKKAKGKIVTVSIDQILERFGRDVMKLVRLEPTCIKCNCTEYDACVGGCSWSFLNKKTNEGLCSACFGKLRDPY